MGAVGTPFVNSINDADNCTYVSSRSNSYQSLNSSNVSTASTTDTSYTELNESNQHKTDNLKVYYMNADCLLNKINELQVLITLYNPDVIVVSEVFPKNCNPKLVHCNEYKLQGYNCFTGNIAEHSRGLQFMYMRGFLLTSVIF